MWNSSKPKENLTNTLLYSTLYSTTVSANTDTELLEEVVTDVDEGHQLIVYNDDINTFEHVIQTLIDVCKHTTQQAEQCTFIIHYNGKCSVKEGSWNDLVSMRNSICDRGISAEVE